MVSAGGYAVSLSDGSRDILPGMARISPPGATPWVDIDGGGATCLVIDAEGAFWHRVFSRLSPPPWRETIVSSQIPTIEKTVAQPPSLLTIGRVLASFRSTRPTRDFASAAAREIDRGFRSLSLSKLADGLGVARGRFASEFLLATGFLPAEYRMLKRIAAAQSLLAKSNNTLVEISDAAGFANQSHMTACFSAVLGATPMRHRAAMTHF